MAQNETLELPLLPLRDLIIFPHMMMPLFVGREKSINALEEAMSKQIDIVLAAQKDAKTNNPSPEEVYQIGTLGTKSKASPTPRNFLRLK
jgi:ATP-dependent Lon protease